MNANPPSIMMDVSCLVPQPLTGVGYYTLHLLQAFAARRAEWDLRLFASSARGAAAAADRLRAISENVHTAPLPTRLKNALWTRLEWPPIEWFAGRADIAHGAFHLLPASRRAKRAVTVFDLSWLRCTDTRTAANTAMHLRLLRHAVRRADAIIAISKSCRNDLIELLDAPEDRVHVVYGGVFPEEFAGPMEAAEVARLRARFGIGRPYFLHLGTIEPRKNLLRLIDAYVRVYTRRPDCPALVLAGKRGWMCEDLFRAVDRLRLDESIIMPGYVTREEAVLLLRNAFACVYPSLYEGFGLPVLEAMAARTPVLTSNVSSLPEVIGDCGVLVEPEDTDSITAGLEQLLDDAAGRAARAEAAYARAQQFTWAASAESLAGVYRDLLEGGAA